MRKKFIGVSIIALTLETGALASPPLYTSFPPNPNNGPNNLVVAPNNPAAIPSNPPSTGNQSSISGPCLPINQPIDFTISDAYEDGITVVGGDIQTAAGHSSDLSSAGIQVGQDVGEVVLKATPVTSQSPQVGFRQSNESQLFVQIDSNTGSDPGLHGTVHGKLIIKPSELAYMAYVLAGRSIQKDPKTQAILPQVNDFCVRSIALIGHFTTDSTSINGNFQGAVLLYMNKGHFEFEAKNTDLPAKPKTPGNNSGASDDVRLADLPASSGDAAL
ncbi:MAG: hypothetical protein P4M08_14015 [Oligoflexia bacterium]|nr:hypothetical protein [Oligoflexia bacterium]